MESTEETQRDEHQTPMFSDEVAEELCLSAMNLVNMTCYEQTALWIRLESLIDVLDDVVGAIDWRQVSRPTRKLFRLRLKRAKEVLKQIEPVSARFPSLPKGPIEDAQRLRIRELAFRIVETPKV
jgi:hypothetical protein